MTLAEDSAMLRGFMDTHSSRLITFTSPGAAANAREVMPPTANIAPAAREPKMKSRLLPAIPFSSITMFMTICRKRYPT